jgi:hypothetical protein
LSAEANLSISITRQAAGLRRRGQCVAPGRILGRHHPPGCSRTIPVGTLKRSRQPQGADRIGFTGRLGLRPLRPGHYRAVLRGVNVGGHSNQVTLSFVVVP